MDDPFDPSVWSLPSSSSRPPPKQEDVLPPSPPAVEPAEPSDANAFDEFDDFSAEPASAGDADFGDEFGDFGEGAEVEEGGAFPAQETFEETAPRPPPPAPDQGDIRPLVLRPFPAPDELDAQIHALIDPIFGHIDTGQIFSDEPIRQVEGLAQVLVTPECRSIYQSLMEIPPGMTRPINWTRSRIRRQHLIALGVPVNLDEVLPSANAKPLPTLHITITPTARPASAPPGRPSTPAGHISRANTPVPGGRTPKTGPPSLGPAPKLDMDKVDEALSHTESTLSILPLAAVEAELSNIRSVTESTNALLTHLLQSRDVLQQDSETYNRLIAELVGEAQKTKAPQSTSRWGRKDKRTSTLNAS